MRPDGVVQQRAGEGEAIRRGAEERAAEPVHFSLGNRAQVCQVDDLSLSLWDVGFQKPVSGAHLASAPVEGWLVSIASSACGVSAVIAFALRLGKARAWLRCLEGGPGTFSQPTC